MPSPRHILIATGSRAEFGLLQPVMRAIAAEPKLRLSVVVAGSHLVSGTWRDVTGAGFQIAARVRMQKRGATGRLADVAAVGRGVAGLGKAFDEMKPDVVLVLGDRIEAFAAATAASLGGFHLAHIHGGDRAEGVADEAMRHAISKLAHLHFAATALSRKRLVRMGENPAHIWNVGSPAADGLNDVHPAKEGVELIVSQHPVGADDAREKRWMEATLAATARFAGRRLIVGPNLDAGAAGVRAALSRKRGQMPDRVVEHLPRGEFLRFLAGARAIVGNSSAGLIEAAVLGIPCVNIGPRQAGRERGRNVVDCDYGVAPVRQALQKALTLRPGRRHPYGDGRAGQRLARLLAQTPLDQIPLRKRNRY